MTNTIQSKMPEPDSRDRIHKFLTTLVSPIPYASEIIAEIIKTPLEKRNKEWFQSIADGLIALEKKVDEFKIENLSANETFVTALLDLTPIAIHNHQKEKLKTLRNAVLNSALPQAPDDTHQKIFNQWLDELTETHVRILVLFDTEIMPDIDIDNEGWLINLNLSKIFSVIENSYPEMRGQDSLSIQIIKDLRIKGLITNKFPRPNMLSKLESSPKPTPLAKKFLNFIKSPVD